MFLGTVGLASAAAPAPAFVPALAKSTLEQPIGFRISQHDPRLKEIFGGMGSALCFPTSLAHRVIHQALVRRPALTRLQILPLRLSSSDEVLIEQVKSFYLSCGTDQNKGTSVPQALGCIRRFFKASGYDPLTEIVGISAVKPKLQRWPSPDDFKTYLEGDPGMIARVGWYTWSSTQKQWVRSGGHYFNVYGYRHEASWSDQKIMLQLVNPDVDYTDRPEGQDFDWVEARMISRGDRRYFLDGVGFERPGRRAIVEDLLVFTGGAP